MIEEETYGWDGFCQHGVNPHLCYLCTPSTANKPNDTESLADTINEAVEDLLN